MVKLPVEVKIILVGEIRYILRVAAGFHTIGIIREERMHNPAVKHLKLQYDDRG